VLTSRRHDPGGPALAILDAVIDVARREIARQHPQLDPVLHANDPFDAVDLVARLLVNRLDELRDLADAYRRAVDDSAGAGLF